MSRYIAVTVRSARKKTQWLGRLTLDGEVNLVAEFVTAHQLKVVVAKLNEEPLPELKMDPEQPQKVDFHSIGRHPDSVRAHNARYPNEQRDPDTGRSLREAGLHDQPAPQQDPVRAAAGGEREHGDSGDEADPPGA